ncbi:hypothetical protein K457DRAFT_135455 [Linnemannia elongata AG-77]|uniref:Uncharacterized protein n=1 Tax=Linnemannia elongata AG-77 TaxID=1314771 RepID=A0A197K3S0_9FUNG|nr:hypothetical protein K457DRAFT_135455 [Linnemannia elongata AG-77]
MPKYKPTNPGTSSYIRSLLLSDITPIGNSTGAPSSSDVEDVQNLRYYALLAQARAGTSQESQPSQLAGSHKHRGKGFTLRYRMELVEIYRYLRQTKDVKVTSSNFHTFVKADIPRGSIKQWDKDYDKIKYDVLHGRGDKCTLSHDQVTPRERSSSVESHDPTSFKAASEGEVLETKVRERSSSIEPDDLNSFKALDGVTTKVENLLASDDPKTRQAARVIIRSLVPSKNKI